VTDESYMVVGAGVVGQATAAFLDSLGVDCDLIDIDATRVAQLRNRGLRAFSEPQNYSPLVTAMVCVPTPSSDAGHDLDALLDAVGAVARLKGLRRLTVVIRSTVTPGTCENHLTGLLATTVAQDCETALVYMPEFLRQAHAQRDALAPRAIVIASKNACALQRLKALCAPYSDRIVELTDPTTAEMIKIAHNAWNATKISYWNELFRLGAAHNIEMTDVARVVATTAEASWNPMYGIRGGSPFEGACLPKDLSALIAHARSVGLEPSLLSAVEAVNERERAGLIRS
jgi:UDPglucose 6-dehydrogenase